MGIHCKHRKDTINMHFHTMLCLPLLFQYKGTIYMLIQTIPYIIYSKYSDRQPEKFNIFLIWSNQKKFVTQLPSTNTVKNF